MKKFVLICILLISFEGYSQITLDFQTSVIYLRTVRLSNTVTKYSRDFNYANSIIDFSLYNLDGTVYKTIYLPPKPDPSASIYYISNISESLFDNDSTNIEYLITYIIDSAGYSFSQVQVVREDETILLNEPKAGPDFWPSNFDDASIYCTEEGTKLRLYYAFATGIDYQTKVFNLPGEIPTSIMEDKNLSNNSLSIYPNPNNGSFSINLQSSEGISTIDLFSSTGKLINSYKASGNNLNITNSGLSEGLYLLNATSNKLYLRSKIIIKK